MPIIKIYMPFKSWNIPSEEALQIEEEIWGRVCQFKFSDSMVIDQRHTNCKNVKQKSQPYILVKSTDPTEEAFLAMTVNDLLDTETPTKFFPKGSLLKAS